MRTSYVTRFVRAYPGLKTGTKEYRRAAGRVARQRRIERLGRDEYLRRERERAHRDRLRRMERLGREAVLQRERTLARARYWAARGLL